MGQNPRFLVRVPVAELLKFVTACLLTVGSCCQFSQVSFSADEAGMVRCKTIRSRIAGQSLEKAVFTVPLSNSLMMRNVWSNNVTLWFIIELTTSDYSVLWLCSIKGPICVSNLLVASFKRILAAEAVRPSIRRAPLVIMIIVYSENSHCYLSRQTTASNFLLLLLAWQATSGGVR